MSELSIIFFMFLDETDPPYKKLTFLIFFFFHKYFFTKLLTSNISCELGIKPVPIDHIGS